MMKKAGTEEWADPDLLKEVRKYGKFDTNACLNCGGCTITCTLASNDSPFSPRASLQYVRTGLRGRLLNNLDPWLCYYCGDCSTSCPRQADPGETMMTLRRFLTAQYDWTGFARLFNRSIAWITGAFFLVGVLIILAAIGIFHPEPFNVMGFGHSFELYSILTVFCLILLPCIFRMYWFTILKEKVRVPISSYITQLGALIWHFITQNKFLECTTNVFRWFVHLLVVFGYILMLITVVFFKWLETTNTAIIWLGYIVSGIVTLASIYFIITRIIKDKEMNKYSRYTDWVFVIWLFLIAFTGFMVRLLLDVGFSEEQLIIIYIIHLIVLAQWAVIIVPFGKWTHFLYRPFAIYFYRIKEKAFQIQQQKLNKLSIPEVK